MPKLKLTEITAPCAIVTLGPTDESIDDVMKITNMSTGRLGVEIAVSLMNTYSGYPTPMKLLLVGNKTAYRSNVTEIRKLEEQGAEYVTVGGFKDGAYVTSETDDMLKVLERLMTDNRVDFIFHSAAVGDYTGKFATNNILLAEEIMELLRTNGTAVTADDIAKVLAAPSRVFNSDTKMSSDEPHMIVGLGLTPKVIARINGFAENNGYKTRLISWKLLSDVPKEELYDVALHHGKRNGSWLVVANDLSRISDGGHWAMVLDVAEETAHEVNTKGEIADYLSTLTLAEAQRELLERSVELGFKFKDGVEFKLLTAENGVNIGAVAIEGDHALMHIMAEFQGRGLGRDAVSLCLDEGLQLYASDVWGNKQTYEKFGLTVCGTDERGCELMSR